LFASFAQIFSREKMSLPLREYQVQAIHQGRLDLRRKDGSQVGRKRIEAQGGGGHRLDGGDARGV
jgi:hypothetical protein